jgi:hypothetical protein
MKLMSSLPNYNQPRLQTSVTTLPSARLANAHPPQADAQRSGGSNSSYFRPGGMVVAGLFLLGLQDFSAYVERNSTYTKILTNPRNCERSISMVKDHLQSLDLKNVKNLSDRIQEEAKNQRSTASEILKEITQNCKKKQSPVK